MKTSACTTPVGSMSKAVEKALGAIHDTVISKYYGCGLCIPPALEGATVLDLGCGAGRFFKCWEFLLKFWDKGRLCYRTACRRVWKSHRSWYDRWTAGDCSWIRRISPWEVWICQIKCFFQKRFWKILNQIYYKKVYY